MQLSDIYQIIKLFTLLERDWIVQGMLTYIYSS